jgi:F1F0 ATPase subunit 2
MILRLAFDTMRGILLGVLFYGGLWLTVRRFPTTHHPLALALGSLLLRMAITLAGFYLIIDGQWQNAVAALAGFTAARVLIVNRRTPCI